MTFIFLVVGAIAAPLLFLAAFAGAYRLFSILGGFRSLQQLYASDSSPPNTTMATFTVGRFLRDSGASVGASTNGLFLHRSFGEGGVLIPWVQLTYLGSFLGFASFRERQTRLRISVPRSIVSSFLDPVHPATRIENGD